MDFTPRSRISIYNQTLIRVARLLLLAFLPQPHAFFMTDLSMDLMQHPNVTKSVHKDRVRYTVANQLCHRLNLCTTGGHRLVICLLYIRNRDIDPARFWVVRSGSDQMEIRVLVQKMEANAVQIEDDFIFALRKIGHLDALDLKNLFIQIQCF